MFTQRQMSQLGAGGGGRPPRLGLGQVSSHQVNRLRRGPGGAARRQGGARVARRGTASSTSPTPSRLDFQIFNKTHGRWRRSIQLPGFRLRPGGGSPEAGSGSSRHGPALHGRKGCLPGVGQSCSPIPNQKPALQTLGNPTTPRASPGEVRHTQGLTPKLHGIATA